MNTERATGRWPLAAGRAVRSAGHGAVCSVIGMVATSITLCAQSPYVSPADPLVQQKLEQWQDLKFGLLMHWGPYSQWGVVESWSICPEDEGWCARKPEHGATYNEYVKNYEALQTTFDPVKFNPDKWAKAAKDAGMKYMVFTTKHHDGFCMFDTKLTDYRVTDAKCPFHDHPRANIAKGVFDAFRKEGLWTGAYFSKPDWHSPYYWWPYFPPKDRNVNYLPTRYPERWQQFKDFTSGQIEELMTGYGPMDILWLDGGQVRPLSTIDTNVSWQKAILIDQNIDMPRIAAMARKHQPGLLVVDRTVGGEYENYVTPEGHVPDADLGVPWETCMPMGTSWSWVPNEQYKSTDEIIRTLVNVVSRGGSLLLNVAPGPDGQLDSTAYVRLKEVGAWLKVNGEAVYGTRPVEKYREGILGQTMATDGSAHYLFLEYGGKWGFDWPESRMPSAFALKNGARLKVSREHGRLRVNIRESVHSEEGGGVMVVKLIRR
jgi:alpha-L-fucosidase